MHKHSKILLIFASLLGTLSIISAATGAHGAIQEQLIQQQLFDTFSKAVNYAMYGALSLVAIAALQQLLPTIRYFISGYLIALGTALFSGSLFAYTIAGMKSLTNLTPFGGTLMILGWLPLGLLTLLYKPK